jgi:hypothetical protein
MALLVSGLGIAQGALVAGQSYVPMAAGGSGTVTKPTLFLAGEAGPEDYSFAPKSKGGMGGGTVINHIYNVSGSIWQTQELETMARNAQYAGAGY